MTTPEILRKAARRVRSGWCQGYLADSHGRVCALGAIGEAGRRSFHVPMTTEVAAAIVALEETLHPYTTTEWNDADGRTAEEVAATMERVADQLEYPAVAWTHRELVHP